MYKRLLLSFLFVYSSALLGQNEFITTWEMTNSDLSISISTSGSLIYNYTIDFGDGTVLNNQTGDSAHTYATPGIYTVEISGDFPQFNQLSNTDRGDLRSVEQWGDLQWASMEGAFSGCFNLEINATDVPNLSNVTDMSFMFNGAAAFNQSINDWDVSNVTNMAQMFEGATSFNQPLDNWDVSNVTEMFRMFFGADAFNQDLNNWDITSVNNMNAMFQDADSFNQPLSNWNVSNLTAMFRVFSYADSFNQPLDSWDVSNVTNMEAMFEGAASFNQLIDNWDVSNVINMRAMFFEALSFNQPLNDWDVSSVTDMSFMFNGTDAFNQPLDNWDIANVTNVENMFRFSAFNQDLSNWDFNINIFASFIAQSAMDTENADLLMDRFAQLGIENGIIRVSGIEFCDIFTLQYLENTKGWTFQSIDDDFNLGANCGINYIKGNIKYDENADGCGVDEGINQFLVTIDNGLESVSTLADEDGNYLFKVIQDTYTVSVLNLPSYLSVSPSPQDVSFLGINEIEDNIDFCITANVLVEDLLVDLFPLNSAIPGFESEYEIIIENKGTQTISNVEVTVDYNDLFQSFVSASQTPDSTTPGSIVIIIPSLPFNGSTILTFRLLNVEPPNLNSGDLLNITVSVVADIDDLNPEDNEVELEQTVVNSFDPNDKLVTQGDEITVNNINDYLDYKIRFQNVGTANARNVKITDTISDKLDWTTFQPINSSHNYRMELKDQEEINFLFDNIDLPYEDLDEEGSNGHVSFRIKPKSNVQIGDIIDNTAYIFFDFNAPIITNTVSTTIVDNLGLDEFTGSDSIKLSPNPASNQVEIIHGSHINIYEVKIYTAIGKLVKTYKNSKLLDISQFNNGVYLIKIQTPFGSLTKKLIVAK